MSIVRPRGETSGGGNGPRPEAASSRYAAAPISHHTGAPESALRNASFAAVTSGGTACGRNSRGSKGLRTSRTVSLMTSSLTATLLRLRQTHVARDTPRRCAGSLADHIHQSLPTLAPHDIERALERAGQLLGVGHPLAVSTGRFDVLLEVRCGLEAAQRHRPAAARRMAVGMDAERRPFDRAPLPLPHCRLLHTTVSTGSRKAAAV